MKLRDHPCMVYRGVAGWPPVWTKQTDAVKKSLTGEMGVLKHVQAYEEISNRCVMVIEHEGEMYVGSLFVAELEACKEIARLLKTQVGRPIRDIGDLDASHIN